MKCNTFPHRGKRKQNFCLQSLPTDYQWKVLSYLTTDLTPYLSESEYLQISNITRNRDIDAYLLLSKDWSLQRIDSGKDVARVTPTMYFLANLLKKFQFATHAGSRRLRAVEKFHLYENRCASFNRLAVFKLGWADTDWGSEVFTYLRTFFNKLLGHVLPSGKILTEWSRHGPGTSLGMVDGQTCTYHKYKNWPYTCTKAALGYAITAISSDERWIGALQDSYRERFGIPYQYPICMETFWDRVFTIVPGNKITFVPKDGQIDRTIAIEPTMNLWLQLGVDGYIRRRLLRWGVDLNAQNLNQELARLGSLHFDHPDPYVTIDLEGASDSISTSLLELILPEAWYRYLCHLRSPVGTLDGELIQYEKFSSMGNGFTFALESAIFTAIIYAVYKADGVALRPNKFAVYGDDLIIPRSAVYKVVELLRLTGFTINIDKSFLFGKVRESCGADWLEGTPCRPVFLRNIPSTVPELFSDFNRLKRILELRFGILQEESKTLSIMKTWIPNFALDILGPYSNIEFDAYIHTTNNTCYSRSVFKHKRLVTTPVPQSCTNFLFGKLQHDLRPTSSVSEGGGGSRFVVTHRKKLTTSVKYSVTSYWCKEYEELKPVPV